MAIKKLVAEKELKTNHLELFAEDPARQLFVRYDPDFDALLLLTVPPTIELVVHYIDDQNVALVYDARTFEIVGLQIEDFEYSFVPKHSEVQKVWKLSDSVKISDLQDFGDMILTVQNHTREVARQVYLSSSELFERQGEKMLKSMQGAFAYA